MAGSASHASYLPSVLIFCGAAVVAVPLFRRLGQSAVLGYLAAGLVIGPFGLRLIGDPDTIRGFAELGVVLLLFIVGLELKLSRLIAMRRDIFGLGLAQLLLTGLVLAGGAMVAGFPLAAAVVAGTALALSATSIALQMLEERHDLQTVYGQRAFAILLFQDISIVPILAAVPLAASAGVGAPGGSMMDAGLAAAKAVGAVAFVVLLGRYGLNRFFQLLANSGAREVLTAAALLVVLGTALLMEEVGLSMAMGAFLAGVMLAESNFRHQLEADIEPFRGILLGLFFISVGMSIDLGLVESQWLLLLVGTFAVLAAKIAVVAVSSRAFGSTWREGIRSGAVLSPAGEFAFVLLPLAAGYGLLATSDAQLVTALAALTMLAGPVTAKLVDYALTRRRAATAEPQGEAAAPDPSGSEVLVIGFGRFGQVVNQVLLAQGVEVTVIDKDVERIRGAARFGFRVFFGDGMRLDVLRAAGAERAAIVCLCVDDRETATKIAELIRHEFPQARLFARAYDRIHAIDLMNLEVDYQIRETFESALALGRATLEDLGLASAEAQALVDDVRKRDVARLVMQQAEGMMGGADLLHGARPNPEPLSAPKKRPRALSAQTEDIIADEDVAV